MIWSVRRPYFSASAAECSALSTIASIVTSRASLGSASCAFSSIMLVSSAWSSEPQFTPMRTGFWFFDGDFDHGAEVVVVLAADTDVAGIDAVLRQRARAVGILRQQQMAVVVEVADDGHAQPSLSSRSTIRGDGGRGFVVVDGDAHQLGAGRGERRDLPDGGGDVGGIGVRHGLHHNWCIAAHAHTAHVGGHGLSALKICHGKDLF